MKRRVIEQEKRQGSAVIEQNLKKEEGVEKGLLSHLTSFKMGKKEGRDGLVLR